MAQQVLFLLQRNFQYRGAYCYSLPCATYPINRNISVPCPASLNPSRETVFWEGLTVISKYWIKESGSLTLTKPNKFSGDLNTRATQYIVVDLSNGGQKENLLQIYNCHLSYLVDEANLNIEDTLAYVMKTTGGTGNFILAGDLNAEPDQLPIKTINQSGILTDLWVHMWGASSPGYTFPSNQPIKRIDYIFASKSLTTICENIRVVGNTANNGLYPSDHFGVVASFNMQIPNLSTEVNDMESDFHIV
eukprot:TRINITY_DN3899_c0_g1_i1.p1 TRINITY_DN3899_c0_g1~~TRINITY_DN3899_c0_g1_i1.p1  ORF type:complete len:248 (+),score=34.62 TRINITY_DN3899_c0_g1_i1:1076-1819(+)